MKTFWQKLNKPFFVLAPMADVTDCAFRSVITKYGKPDVFWTEFVSADGLAHKDAREKLLIDLRYGKNEHPIVAQIFGGKPQNIKEATKLCAELGFDGVDINMGCPDRAIEKQCAGCGMIKNSELAGKIILSAKKGVMSAGSNIPISVKTRLGYNKIDEEWIKFLLKQDIAMLAVHLRTRKEMSKVPAHWDYMKRIVEIRDEMGVNTLIVGNGDVIDLADAKEKSKESGCDGVMLGRAIFGNPWLFSGAGQKSVEEKLKVMIEHTKLFEKMLSSPEGGKNFAIMKKHYKAYVNGFDGAKELRMRLMEAKNAKGVEKIVNNFLSTLKNHDFRV